MKNNVIAGRAFVAALFAVSGALTSPAHADDSVSIELTLKGHAFTPAEPTAPAGKPLTITLTNMDPTPAEFESKKLKFEKIVPAGGKITVNVRPLETGRYKFDDDYREDTTVGYVVVQ